MPTYSFRCHECDEEQEVVRAVDDRNSDIHCVCGNMMSRMYNVGYSKIFTPYYSNQLDTYFQSSGDEKTYMKEKGLVDITNDFEWNRQGKDRS